MKHYATTHNLFKGNNNAIKDADEFALQVWKYTDSINVLVLRKEELEVFREKKKLEWQENAKELEGIQKLHCWKAENNGIYTARTAKYSWNKMN